MNHRPAGFSDSEDSDEFELSSDYGLEWRRPGLVARAGAGATETPEDAAYAAVGNGDAAALRSQLDAGLAVDTPLAGGWSALMHASANGSRQIMEMLIAHGANVNFNHELFTPLMALCKCTSKDEDELLRCMDLLFERGAVAGAADHNASTALMLAAAAGHDRLVARLVAHGVDANLQDVEGWSALFHAVNAGNEAIVQTLLAGRARVDLIDKRKRSCCEIATQRGFDELARLVANKREKRRMLAADTATNFYAPARLKDPVEELFAQLPAENAKSRSGFPSDVGKILWSVGLGHFAAVFAARGVQLNELLLISDERLKEIGLRFSVHRERVLCAVRAFHLRRWNKASLGARPCDRRPTVADAVRLACGAAKHLHVMAATAAWARARRPPGPPPPAAIALARDSAHQLALIGAELAAIRRFAADLERKEPVESVDLLRPTNKRNNRSIGAWGICTVSVFVGIVLWKRGCLDLPLSSFPSTSFRIFPIV